jgi:hypothetical protein
MQYLPLTWLPEWLIDLAHEEIVVVIDCTDCVASAILSIEELQEYCMYILYTKLSMRKYVSQMRSYRTIWFYA